MLARSIAVSCAVACGASPPPLPDLPPEITIPAAPQSLGPLSARTPATLIELRKALAPYAVIPVNVDTDPDKPALEYQVYDGSKRMFVVVPADDGAILNVHINTPKVKVIGHPWRVGARFSQSWVLSRCECWGERPVCFKTGDHVAVAFDRNCGGTKTRRGRGKLDGVVIERLIWQPKPFGGDETGSGEEEGEPIVEEAP